MSNIIQQIGEKIVKEKKIPSMIHAEFLSVKLSFNLAHYMIPSLLYHNTLICILPLIFVELKFSQVSISYTGP